MRPDQGWTVFTILLTVRVIPKNPLDPADYKFRKFATYCANPHLTWQSGKCGGSIKRALPHSEATTQKTVHKNCPRFWFSRSPAEKKFVKLI